MTFELTNNDRKYIGVKPIESHWDLVQLNDQIQLFFDGSRIVKSITRSEVAYQESDMDEATSDNRTILMPKTKRGKPRKLNFSSFQSRTGIGTYFSYTAEQGITIGNFTTQKTFYDTRFEEVEIKDFEALRKWVDNFIDSSAQGHLVEIENFGKERKTRVNIKEGDFFAFKVDRKNYGFGRVLLDIRKLREEKFFEKENHYGLSNLMTKPLVVKVYHRISKDKNIDISELRSHNCFPSQYIMDNKLFYGDYEIIGNLPLEMPELEFPISFSRSIDHNNMGIVYLQWGLIYREKNINTLPKNLSEITFRNEGIGFNLDLNKRIVENCIISNSNEDYWNSEFSYVIKEDLRNPKHKASRDLIFKEFGVNPELKYYENEP